MSALLSDFAVQIGLLLAAVIGGLVGLNLYGARKKSEGKQEGRIEQMNREASARQKAAEVEDEIAKMAADDRREELKQWSPDRSH